MSYHYTQQTQEQIYAKQQPPQSTVDYYHEYQSATLNVREEARALTLEVLHALAKINSKFDTVDRRLQGLEERMNRLEKQKCPSCKGTPNGCMGQCVVCLGSGSLRSN